MLEGEREAQVFESEVQIMQLVKLARRNAALTTDARYLSNRHSMEIVWTRIEQLAENIEANQSPDQLAKLQQLWQEFRAADSSGSTVEAVKLKRKLDDEFEKVYHAYASWTQMFDAVELYRKMTESEVKIAKDLKAIMTAEDGMELVTQMLSIVIQVVNDPILLKRIIYEFRKLIGEDRLSDDEVKKRAAEWAGVGGRETIGT